MTLSRAKKPRAVIKSTPEDFVVEEITPEFKVLEIGKEYNAQDIGARKCRGPEGRFCIFIMQKTDWNTVQALKAIANKLHRGFRSVGFAGTKDRAALTTQMCSLYGVMPEQLGSISIKDIRINGAWASDRQVRLGDLEGNRFAVRLNGMSEGLDAAYSSDYKVFPNYFGEQRFGSRGNNKDVGVHILNKRFEDAVMAFLTDVDNETNEGAIGARTRLKDDMDFSQALQYFPRYLKYERQVIEYISRFPGNYANALRRLPRQLLMMFVHSVEAYMFNSVLEDRIKGQRISPESGETVCMADRYGFPKYDSMRTYDDGTKDADVFALGNIVGYDTKNISDAEARLMNEIGISAESFKLKSIPEIRCKGSQRVLFAPYKDFAYDDTDRTVRFSLPSGSYATVFLRELVDL